MKTIYTALSGMTAYRKGLDAISNNVANLNTPGYKTQTPLFLDVVNRSGGGVGQDSRGAGVTVREDQASFTQGELRSTGNSLDAAVDGAGFFVTQKDDHYYYSRAGQFEFDKDGYLVDRTSAARVVVKTDELALTNINIESLRTFAPRATTVVSLAGNLARSGTATYQLPSIAVFDEAGTSHTLSIACTRNGTDPLQWIVEVHEKQAGSGAETVLGSGEIKFNADGSLAEVVSPLIAHIASADLPAFDVQFDLGAPSSYAGITSLVSDTQSRLQMLKQDGVAFGSMTTAEFDDRGQLTLHYTNGEKRTPATLVLARFTSTQGLASVGNGQYAPTDTAEPQLGTAQSHGLGRLVGGQIELSNVDLTNQFTDLIIIQRGYQASSQMASVANEMAQQLLAMSQGR